MSIPNLISQLHTIDPNNPDLQWEACIELGRVPDARNNIEIVSALMGALEIDHFALTRAHAAEALGNLGIRSAVESLVRSLRNDPYRLVKAYAAAALGKIINENDNAAIDALIERVEMKSEYFGVRAEAAKALGTVCKGSRSEFCQKAALTLTKWDDERKQKVKEQKEVGKQDEELIKRFYSEVEIALNKIKEIKDNLNEIKEDVKGVDEDVTNMERETRETSQAIEKSDNNVINAERIKKLNEKIQAKAISIRKKTSKIEERVDSLEDSLESAYEPFILLRGGRRS